MDNWKEVTPWPKAAGIDWQLFFLLSSYLLHY